MTVCVLLYTIWTTGNVWWLSVLGKTNMIIKLISMKYSIGNWEEMNERTFKNGFPELESET